MPDDNSALALFLPDQWCLCFLIFFTPVTVKLAVAVLPLLSVAVTTTEWVPSGKKLPDGGLAVAVTGPSTRSVALTENKTIAPRLGILPLRTVMFDGTVITGGVVSPASKKLRGLVP